MCNRYNVKGSASDIAEYSEATLGIASTWNHDVVPRGHAAGKSLAVPGAQGSKTVITGDFRLA